MARTAAGTTSKNARAVKRPARRRAAQRGAAHGATSQPVQDTQVLGIAITHPDRPLYAEPDVTKLELARYYESVSTLIMPHLADRRVALLRCPDGTAGECFFQKHMGEHLPAGVELDEDMLVIRDIAGVIGLVQRGVIEFHTWGAKSPGADKPDRLTFDLDPDPHTPWPRIAEATRVLRDLLRDVGLQPFLKTTGGKGLHVVVPVRATLGWDDVRRFCKGVAQQLEDMQPEVFVANMSKAKRQDHIFVDYLRNSDGATAVAAFSARARAGAPVSMPVPWDVIGAADDPRGDAYNVRNVLERVRARPDDPWAGYESGRKALTAAMRDKFDAA
ncbi:non-homologous end-joining DNA ligase [Bordetella sp. H567]|uniref:non-homologous end-joining DNA ligase n=1 Tax=Bordetella sp. H567 TaxID=1697043 RepID=UPI0009F6C44F|nr:non-homologous end-joining DNA ligase [Bordetella sp. H567]